MTCAHGGVGAGGVLGLGFVFLFHCFLHFNYVVFFKPTLTSGALNEKNKHRNTHSISCQRKNGLRQIELDVPQRYPFAPKRKIIFVPTEFDVLRQKVGGFHCNHESSLTHGMRLMIPEFIALRTVNYCVTPGIRMHTGAFPSPVVLVASRMAFPRARFT